MKNRTQMIILLVLSLVLVLSLASCTTPARLVFPPQPPASIANPMHLSSQAEIRELDGIFLSIPEGSANDTWFRIFSAGTPVLDQVAFEYESVMYLYRAQKTADLQDTSGMYYVWNQPETIEEVQVFTTPEGQGIALWFTDGVSYSLAMTENGTAKNLMEMYQMVK